MCVCVYVYEIFVISIPNQMRITMLALARHQMDDELNFTQNMRNPIFLGFSKAFFSSKLHSPRICLCCQFFFFRFSIANAISTKPSLPSRGRQPCQRWVDMKNTLQSLFCVKQNWNLQREMGCHLSVSSFGALHACRW